MKHAFLLLLGLALLQYSSFSQNMAKENALRIGAEAGLNLFLPTELRNDIPHDLNIMIDHWDANEPNIDLIRITDLLVGYSFSGYLGVPVKRLIELRPEVDYLYAPIKFWDPEDDVTYVDILIESVSPGISLNFLLGKFQLGGGVYQSRSTIAWNDYVNDELFEWQGKTTGYKLNAGMNFQFSKNIGMTWVVLFKKALVKELTDESGAEMRLVPTNRNFELDQTSIESRIGFYLSI